MAIERIYDAISKDTYTKNIEDSDIAEMKKNYEYQERIRPRTEMEGLVALAKTVLTERIAESKDKTLGIQCMALFPAYEQNKQHEVGEVALHPDTGYPYECMTTYDGTVQQDWTIDNRTLWKPWHSRKAEYALPWEAPTGAHDMYKAGEYMIWTDGTVKKCIQDTNFSPDDWPQAWEDAG